MSTLIETPAADVLLVEDNPADQKLLRMLFKSYGWVRTLHILSDGEAALDFLHQRAAHALAPRPDFIILDWNLPLRDGSEVLAELKADPSLRTIPVVVFTSSRAESDIEKSRSLGADYYLNKEAGLEAYIAIVEEMGRLWESRHRVAPEPSTAERSMPDAVT